MSRPAAISISILGALIALALAAGAGWMIGSFFCRLRQSPPQRFGPLLWLAGRSRRFWVLATTLPMLYLASFGPACWISSSIQPGGQFVNAVYPLLLKSIWHWDMLGVGPTLEPGHLLFRYAVVGETSGNPGVGPSEIDGRIRISFRRLPNLP